MAWLVDAAADALGAAELLDAVGGAAPSSARAAGEGGAGAVAWHAATPHHAAIMLEPSRGKVMRRARYAGERAAGEMERPRLLVVAGDPPFGSLETSPCLGVTGPGCGAHVRRAADGECVPVEPTVYVGVGAECVRRGSTDTTVCVPFLPEGSACAPGDGAVACEPWLWCTGGACRRLPNPQCG